MKITTNSTDTYPTLTNITYTSFTPNVYEAFMDSLSYEKNKAIEAAYDAGYITEDEARQLRESGFALRNEYTNIYVTSEFLDRITLLCTEREYDGYLSTTNIIFKLSYLKNNGILIDELNNDITN